MWSALGGPLDGQVGCVTGYLVTAMFVTLPFFPHKKKFIGKKPHLNMLDQ